MKEIQEEQPSVDELIQEEEELREEEKLLAEKEEEAVEEDRIVKEILEEGSFSGKRIGRRNPCRRTTVGGRG